MEKVIKVKCLGCKKVLVALAKIDDSSGDIRKYIEIYGGGRKESPYGYRATYCHECIANLGKKEVCPSPCLEKTATSKRKESTPPPSPCDKNTQLIGIPYLSSHPSSNSMTLDGLKEEALSSLEKIYKAYGEHEFHKTVQGITLRLTSHENRLDESIPKDDESRESIVEEDETAYLPTVKYASDLLPDQDKRLISELVEQREWTKRDFAVAKDLIEYSSQDLAAIYPVVKKVATKSECFLIYELAQRFRVFDFDSLSTFWNYFFSKEGNDKTAQILCQDFLTALEEVLFKDSGYVAADVVVQSFGAKHAIKRLGEEEKRIKAKYSSILENIVEYAEEANEGIENLKEYIEDEGGLWLRRIDLLD